MEHIALRVLFSAVALQHHPGSRSSRGGTDRQTSFSPAPEKKKNGRKLKEKKKEKKKKPTTSASFAGFFLTKRQVSRQGTTCVSRQGFPLLSFFSFFFLFPFALVASCLYISSCFLPKRLLHTEQAAPRAALTQSIFFWPNRSRSAPRTRFVVLNPRTASNAPATLQSSLHACALFLL